MQTSESIITELPSSAVLDQNTLAGETAPLSSSEEFNSPSPGRVAVYTADGHLGMGLSIWKEMLQELIDSRELTWRLYMRDFSARYRQSVLGYFWAVVPVLVTVVTFSWLNRTKVLPISGTSLPYPLFVLLSMTVWQLFASGLTSTTQSLVNAGGLITKINFPRETLVLAAFGQSLFEFAIRAVLVAAAFAVYHVMPAWTIVLVPLAVVPLCMFTLAIGLLFSLVNGVLRDAGQVVTFMLTFWMFLTPVVYPASHHVSLLRSLINPVSPFVVAAQDLTSLGHLTQPLAYGIASLFSAILLLTAWRLFHLTEPRIAERV